MIYLKLTRGQIEKYPYSLSDLKKDNPQTSFPAQISDEVLASFGVYKVEDTPKPVHNPGTQICEEKTPAYSDVWKRVWEVRSLTADELAQLQMGQNQSSTARRAEDYVKESDPLFFKAQRGEATMQEWLDKVQEIKDRHPKA